MLKLLLMLIRYSLILLSCSFISLAYADRMNDPLQVYRDEIKQSENHASQAVLDALQAGTESDNNVTPQQQQNPTTPKASETQPHSNASNIDKAFTPEANNSTTSDHSSNKNPWLQPNPWAKQPPNIWERNAKVNPYANAPIPGPTPPNASANTAIPSPPNIFTPSRRTNTNNPQANANS